MMDTSVEELREALCDHDHHHGGDDGDGGDHASANSLSLASSVLDVGDANDTGEPRVGALVLRGSRCLLARDLSGDPKKKRWEGMAIPSVAVKNNNKNNNTKAAAAAAAADPLALARLAIEVHCGIDIADQKHQIGPLDARVPPLTLFRKSGGVTKVVLMTALEPPPPGPLEDADLSDDEDAYDWYTIARALARVDAPSAALLRTAAFALAAAADAGAVKKQWGGVFGQELVSGSMAASGQDEDGRSGSGSSSADEKQEDPTLDVIVVGAGAAGVGIGVR